MKEYKKNIVKGKVSDWKEDVENLRMCFKNRHIKNKVKILDGWEFDVVR